MPENKSYFELSLKTLVTKQFKDFLILSLLPFFLPISPNDHCIRQFCSTHSFPKGSSVHENTDVLRISRNRGARTSTVENAPLKFGLVPTYSVDMRFRV